MEITKLKTDVDVLPSCLAKAVNNRSSDTVSFKPYTQVFTYMEAVSQLVRYMYTYILAGRHMSFRTDVQRTHQRLQATPLDVGGEDCGHLMPNSRELSSHMHQLGLQNAC